MIASVVRDPIRLAETGRRRRSCRLAALEVTARTGSLVRR